MTDWFEDESFWETAYSTLFPDERFLRAENEAESILGVRRGGRVHSILSTLVPMFCTEMDGIEPLSNVVIILASNRADLIDHDCDSADSFVKRAACWTQPPGGIAASR